MGETNTASDSRTSTPSCTRWESLFISSHHFCYVYCKSKPTIISFCSQTLKYLSKMPCSRQSPEIVKEFLTIMLPHKLTKSVRHFSPRFSFGFCQMYKMRTVFNVGKDQSSSVCFVHYLHLNIFPITRAEKLQLLNHRPQTAVEIQLVSLFSYCHSSLHNTIFLFDLFT